MPLPLRNAPYCKAIKYFVEDTTVKELNGCMSCHFGSSIDTPSWVACFFSVMEDEDTANEGVMIGADLVEAARQIEEETAKALESLADGGAMMALGQLRSLVEMSQNHPEAHVELIEDDPPEVLARANVEVIQDDSHEVPAGQPDPSMDEEDSVPADGDDGQEELGLVEQSVAERSGLDELAAQLSKPSKRMADAGSMEVSEAMADLDEVLESELKRLKPTVPSLLKMPWEMGFAGMVLGGSEVSLVPARVRVGIQAPTGKVPEVPEVLEVEDRKEGVPQSLFQRRAEHKQSKPWKLEEEDRRSRAKTSWLVIIRAMGKVTPVFDMIDAEGEGVLDDIFARKKTGTLEVRASAILLYIRWCSSKGFQAFPCTEPLAYVYVDELRKNNAPATRANSFRSALAFCKGSLMIEGVDSILSSSRVTGSSHRSYLTKRLLRQRDALTVDQVRILENVVELDGPIQDRVFAAHCLLCIYGRLRFGDHQNIEEEPVVEDEFVEYGLTVHKTNNLAGRARRLLPVVAPSEGVSGLDWGSSFIKMRQESALRAWPQTPFLPAPILGGGWSLGKLSSAEASMWLCELLHKFGVPKLTNVGAHSMKATALSWMAKAGMEPKLRRLMGYHIKPKDSSVVLYSRDALAHGLEEFRKIVKQSMNGSFRPDASRSGRWVHEEGQAAAEEWDEVQHEPDEDDEVLDVEHQRPSSVRVDEIIGGKPVERLALEENQSSESEEEDAEHADTEDERNAEKVVVGIVGPPKKATDELYRHRLTGTVHKGSSVETKLACGRVITALMTKIDEPVHAVHSMCKVCMGYRRS